jgi:hypothetical protein
MDEQLLFIPGVLLMIIDRLRAENEVVLAAATASSVRLALDSQMIRLVSFCVASWCLLRRAPPNALELPAYRYREVPQMTLSCSARGLVRPCSQL